MSPKKKPVKKLKKKRDAGDDVLDVELRISTSGTMQVEMTRRQYIEMKSHERHGAVCLDMVPGFDWSGMTMALDFEAEIENVYDDGEIVDA
jgi:hypothetical protein